MTEHHTAHIADDEGLFVPVRTFDEPLNFEDKFIISSPYHEQEHLLELDRLDVGYKAVALAAQSFETTTERNYAYIPYAEAFNIPKIVERAREYSKVFGEETIEDLKVYVIAFRSILHVDVQESTEKRKKLAQIDKDSHTEATTAGGLLKYWFGTPDDVHAKNLATCWWVSRAHAKAGGGGPAHRQGMALVKGWFKHWQVEEYELHITTDGYTFKEANERK